MNNRRNTIGPIPCTVGYVIFCIILFFILKQQNTEMINQQTDETIEVQASLHTSDYKYSITTNNSTRYVYSVTYTYNMNGKSFYYKETVKLKANENAVEKISLHVDKITGNVFYVYELDSNFYVIFFSTTIGIYAVFIAINLIIIACIKAKGMTVDEYLNKNYGSTQQTPTKNEYNAFDRGDLNKKIDTEDPFNQTDCKYNIEKDDPFDDFYKKGDK